MSKNIKRTGKDIKEVPSLTVKESEEQLEKYRQKSKEILNFEFQYFLLSLTTLICTNIYIHKAVKIILIQIEHQQL